MKNKQNFKKDKKYWQAVAVMIGYIIGVGMFGLPFITSKTGLVLFFFYLIFLGLVQYFVHLVYADMIVATKKYHRLPGYANIYLGKVGKHLVFISKLLGDYGALLAYIIISGIFLHQLLGKFLGGGPFLYATIVFLIEAIIVLFGVRLITKVELYMSALLFIVVGIIFFKSFSYASFSNFLPSGNFAFFDWHYLFLPYGVMLVALDGSNTLPMVSKIVRRHPEKFKSVIRTSMILSVLVIVIFVLSIVGISGAKTSEDALSGIKMIIDNGVVSFALILGLFSMMTSFLGVAEALRETFLWDYKINKKLSWFLVVAVPYILYCLGFDKLIAVVGLSGAIAGGFSAIILIFAFMRMREQKHNLKMFKHVISDRFFYFIVFLFVSGIGYTLLTFFN